MLKGIKNYFLHTEPIPSPTYASVRESYYPLPDTTKNAQPDLTQHPLQTTKPEITVNHIEQPHTLEQKHRDSTLKQTDSQEKSILPQTITQPIPAAKINSKDTSATIVYNETLPFQKQRTIQDEIYTNNFLLGIPEKNISGLFNSMILNPDTTSKIITHKKEEKQITTLVQITKERPGFDGIKRNLSADWIPGFLLLSLFVFAWVKILYQKYIEQVVISLVNYQVAVRLLRERNVLFQNMALGLNLIFAVNTGLFIYYLTQFFNMPSDFNQVQTVLIYSFGIILIYNIKTFVCRILGNIFLVKEEFAEYIHNINLYNKNTGLFLFPVVIFFPYIADSIKPSIIYIGIIVIAVMIILRIIRGFQIIMRKGASIFYLILYLCAIEILPVLLIVKLSNTLI